MLYILLTWLLAPIWWPIALLRSVTRKSPRRILVAEIAGIGDVVCSASLFQALRDEYPEATIDLLIDPIAKSLSPILPMVNNVHLFAYPEQKGLKGRLKLARIAARYDTAICLIPSAAQLTSFCWGAVPRRLSVLPGRLNTSYQFLAPLMTVNARHADGSYFPATQFKLCGALLSNNQVRLKNLSYQSGEMPIQLSADKKWVGLLVSSGRALKRLSEEQLVALAEGVLNIAHDQTGIVLLGGPGDRAQAQTVIALLDKAQVVNAVVDTVGQYELAQLPGILLQLSAFVGVDSGVTHMADALGVPVVCIAGPVDLREVYQPGASRKLFNATLACAPCSTVFNTPNKCQMGERLCLDQLYTQALLKQVIDLLKANERPAS